MTQLSCLSGAMRVEKLLDPALRKHVRETSRMRRTALKKGDCHNAIAPAVARELFDVTRSVPSAFLAMHRVSAEAHTQ